MKKVVKNQIEVMDAANHSKNSAMEAENHLKHGCSVTNQKGSVNIFFVLITAIAFCMSSCFKDDNEIVLGVTINGCTERLTTGNEHSLQVDLITGVDEATQYKWFKKPDKVELNRDVTWDSENPDIATVDQNGKITPIKPGNAVITVTSVMTGRMDFCNVEVKDEW